MPKVCCGSRRVQCETNAFLFFEEAIAGRRMTSLPAIQGNREFRYIDKAPRLEYCVHYSEGNHLFIKSGTSMSFPFFTDLINGPAIATRFGKKNTTLVPNSEYYENYINRLISLRLLSPDSLCSNELLGPGPLDPTLKWHSPCMPRLSIEV